MMNALIVGDASAAVVAAAPATKRARTSVGSGMHVPNALPSVRLLCGPTSFTAQPPRPRMYMLPLASRHGGWPSDHSAAGASSTGAVAGAAAAATSAPAPPAGAGAVSEGATGQTFAEPAVCIPLVRPALLQNLDDYLTLVGDMYYQAPETGKSTAQWAILRRTTLGRLTSPIREPSVLDKWSPYEIALFESGICLTGKLFTALASLIKTKTVAEVIEFFYIWKCSKNYAQWKATYKIPLVQNA